MDPKACFALSEKEKATIENEIMAGVRQCRTTETLGVIENEGITPALVLLFFLLRLLLT
jgi:hypothetical protein